MSTRAVIVALIAAAVVAAPGAQDRPPAAQQPPVTFKVEINYVEIDAVVTDAQGNFVRDLTKDDFHVVEDGKPQSVSVFSLVDIPVEREDRPLYAASPIEPDVRTNEREVEGRVYLIVLDDLHTNALRSQRVKVAARQFIERYFGANDMAAVVHTSGRGDASQDFTNNRRLLLASIDKFMGRKLRSATQEKIDEYFRRRGTPQASDPLKDPADFERGYQASNTLRTLKAASDWLTGLRGRRKAMLFISEGIDYDIHDVFNAQYASTILDESREAIAAATRANVNIYAIDPRGLTSMGDESIEIASLPDDTSLGLGQTSLQNELRTAQDSLRVLADETGGFASVNSNDFSTAFRRVVSDNSTYYVLGYYPTNERRDGRFRKVTVRVSRPGLEVRARRGYAAPRGRAARPPAVAGNEGSAALRDALSSPLPVAGLTLRAFAAPFKGAAPNASVLVGVELQGDDLKFAEASGLFNNTLELWVSAWDQTGKVRDSKPNTIKLGLRPETHAAISRLGFRYLTRLQVPPGRYQIRIGGRESGGGKVGTVLYDLEVPDYWEAPFAMGGLVVTSGSASRVPTANPDPELKDVLPGPPAAIREFPAGDTLAVFTEVYDGEAARPHHVDIVTTLTADDGRVVFKTEEDRASSELAGARGGYGIRADLPLKGIAPGLYVLQVEARSRLGRAAARQVQLRVRGS
jgi:VWFA-related protein